MGQIIGTVNVQVGSATTPRINSISYGGKNTILGAADLNATNAINLDVITYQANTNSFVLSPAGQAITNIDGGFF
jgi:hypothetical protein